MMFRSAVRKIAKSTVAILAAWTDNKNPPEMQHCELLGTGFLIEQSLAVTALHVVDEIRKRSGFHQFDGFQWLGTLVTDGLDDDNVTINPRFEWGRMLASSAKDDAALLYVPGAPNVRARLSGSKVTIADPVGALGYPLAENRAGSITARLRFTAGHVSNVGEAKLSPSEPETKVFEVDTMFLPGISGGPVFTPDGCVFALTHGCMTLPKSWLTLSIAVDLRVIPPMVAKAVIALDEEQKKEF